MNKRVLFTASVFGLLAVILGAFGAHGLKASLTAAQLETWKTGVDYQFYHSLALLFVSLIPAGNKSVKVVFYAFTIGIIFFSGSIYLLSTRSITGIQWPFLGPITPIGGLFFITGWITLLISALKK